MRRFGRSQVEVNGSTLIAADVHADTLKKAEAILFDNTPSGPHLHQVRTGAFSYWHTLWKVSLRQVRAGPTIRTAAKAGVSLRTGSFKGKNLTKPRRLWTDQRAATAAEYAIILAVIGVSLAVSVLALGQNIACSINRSADVVSGIDPETGHQYGHSDPPGKAKGHHFTC
jgi:Flp pilus assembly pilin Flp